MTERPEVEVKVKEDKFLLATCLAVDCKWFQYDLPEDRESFDSAVEEHKQWHENGMPE